ncbi:hypothetical protein Anas_05500 [Armadillidium nasatum]|uniref:Uncharacterized protein n=1 Tax=Armadillidium nasatum TaxID=96803 RepID=A0A5N5SXI4_9CRUS|nr:hypothetical protein Anas_05500 [Armadillidium nasatum]
MVEFLYTIVNIKIMDCSIEIIGEVIPEKSSKEEGDKQENEFEVVYDASASKKVIQDSTPLRRRPLRQRKPIRLLREEQQLEEPKKRKSLLKPKKSRLRPLLKMGLSENSDFLACFWKDVKN